MNKKEGVEIGKKYSYVTVLSKVEPKILRDGHKIAQYLCRCECGNTVIFTGQRLTNKSDKLSCGCKRKYKVIKNNTERHGLSKSRLYRVWSSILTRCYNKNGAHYSDYGGRGIAVCNEWRDSFQAFYDWAMANGYDEKANYGECTIDRIDINGNYEPSNCRWVDMTFQNNNKRNTKRRLNKDGKYEINGERKTLHQWCDCYGVSYQTVASRLNLYGWDLIKALTVPPKTQKKIYISYKGEERTVWAWAKRIGINDSTLYNRLKAGWDIEKALTTPSRKTV